MSLNLESASGLNLVLATATNGAALTGLSGAATTYTTSIFGGIINGVAFFNAANAGAATPTTDGNTGAAITLSASQSRVIVWAVNSSGTESVYAGPVVTWPNSSGTATGSPLPLFYPPVPSTVAVFAVHVLSAGSNLASTWTFGSSNWNTTGITVGTVVNTGGWLPNTLQVTP